MESLVVGEDEAAAALGLSPRTLQRWRVEGKGPQFVKVGKRAAYTPEALRDFVAKQTRTSTSDQGGSDRG
jgi:hypothetical protein